MEGELEYRDSPGEPLGSQPSPVTAIAGVSAGGNSGVCLVLAL